MSDEEKKVEETKEEVKTEETPAEEPKAEEKKEEAPAEEKTEEAPAPAEEPEKSEEEQRAEMAEDAAIPEAEEVAQEEAEALPNQDIEPGMLVRVHEKIKDVNARGEEKERVQVFEGLVLGVKNKGIARTMTVRKNSKGWMVEKIFPLASPNIEKVEVVKTFRTRRAKLSYLRGKDFKRKLKEIKNEA